MPSIQVWFMIHHNVMIWLDKPELSLQSKLSKEAVKAETVYIYISVISMWQNKEYDNVLCNFLQIDTPKYPYFEGHNYIRNLPADTDQYQYMDFVCHYFLQSHIR